MSTQTEQDTRDDDAPDPDENMERVRRAVAVLMEHFETCQIFCSRTQDGDTEAFTDGAGNWYARRGQINDWVLKQDAAILDGE